MSYILDRRRSRRNPNLGAVPLFDFDRTIYSPAPIVVKPIIDESSQSPAPLDIPDNPDSPLVEIRPRIHAEPDKLFRKYIEPVRINEPIPTTLPGVSPKPIVTSAPTDRVPTDMPYIVATVPGDYSEPAPYVEPENVEPSLPQAGLIPDNIPWGTIAGLGVISWAIWQGFSGD